MAGLQVWFGTCEIEPEESGALAALLDAEERARAERFHFARDRRRFIVRRGRLRTLIASLTGGDPRTLPLTQNAYGKPALAGGHLHFSASHSGETWLLATAPYAIGADIERIDPAIDWRDLALGLFGAGEIAALDAMPQEQARAAFFACWARKEAFVKALGMGLSYPLTAFEVTVGPDAAFVSGADVWRIQRLDIGADLAGALVLPARADDRAHPIAV